MLRQKLLLSLLVLFLIGIAANAFAQSSVPNTSKQEVKEQITAEDVDKALESKKYRLNSIEEYVAEYIKDGTIMVDTTGSVVGQLNGLVVYDLGDYSFGLPARLTATTSVGRSGIVHFEKETRRSGKSHGGYEFGLGQSARSGRHSRPAHGAGTGHNCRC